MIQPTELRKGNLVYTINRKERVHIVEPTVVKIITLGLFEAEVLLPRLNPANQKKLPSVHYSDLSPIPLSEGWLLKIGFEKRKDSSPQYWFKTGNHRFTFLKWKSENEIHLTCCNQLGRNIKTLHRLQNIYFDLTETELEITI